MAATGDFLVLVNCVIRAELCGSTANILFGGVLRSSAEGILRSSTSSEGDVGDVRSLTFYILT